MADQLIQLTQKLLSRGERGVESGERSTSINNEIKLEQLVVRAQAESKASGDRQFGVGSSQNELANLYLAEGRIGLAKIASKGHHAKLTRKQRIGLEAIVRLTGRPSLYIIDNEVASVPQKSEWAEPLAAAIDEIRRVVQRVGRVNSTKIGGAGYVGTAFLVAPDIVMTNRHVANKIAGEM